MSKTEEFLNQLSDSLIEEAKKLLPGDGVADLEEMSDIQARITVRVFGNRALSVPDVQRYNSLCYKRFGELQDGGEFEKVDKAEKKHIPYNSRKSVYENAIDRYGIKPRMLMAVEEMSELTKEMCKNLRGKDNKAQLAEEIADVTIMLEQLRLIFGVNEEVNDWMDRKLLRLAQNVITVQKVN